MGCCCQLEYKKTSQVDLESLSSHPIHRKLPEETITPELIDDNHIKLNNDTCSERNYLINDIDNDNDISHFNTALPEFRKAITDSHKQKKILARRLETVRETNSEFSFKKSSTNELKGCLMSSLYMTKGKICSDDTLKLSFENEKENYDNKLSEIKRLFDKNISDGDENKYDNDKEYRQKGYERTNHRIYYTSTGFDQAKEGTEQSLMINSLDNNARMNNMSNHEKIVHQFKLLSENETTITTIKKRSHRYNTMSSSGKRMFNTKE